MASNNPKNRNSTAKRMLKADLHIHTKHKRDAFIKYSWKELIDKYAELNYDVMSITNHNEVFYPNEAVEYAKKKGILMIRGTEAMVEGRDVIILNLEKNEKPPKTFLELEKIKKNSNVIMAPHPYFFRHSLMGKLKEHIELFDAVEYSHFYNVFLNLNLFGERIAKKNNLVIIGTSDAHTLDQIGHTYTLLDSKKNIGSIIDAIKKKKCILKTKPLSLRQFIKITLAVLTK